MPAKGRIVDTQAFLNARKALMGELAGEMEQWDFSKLMEEFTAAIARTKDRNPLRLFARHELGYTGERHREVRLWLKNPEGMTISEITLVFVTLKRFRTKGRSPIVRREAAPSAKSGQKREVVIHTITIFNSLESLMVSSGVKPKDVTDGDRMQLQKTFRKISDCVGLKIGFADSSAALNQPVTRGDLASIGLPRRGRK
ncbi:MAG: hypothetical protein JWN50_476 [Parcubacteria group bacterium]|nr:hypothetical protein [Parcubacteria group bacterium]